MEPRRFAHLCPNRVLVRKTGGGKRAGHSGHRPAFAPAYHAARPVAGALEGETLTLVSVSGGNLSVQSGYWEISGGKQRWWQYPKYGDKLTFSFPVKADGLYKVVGSFAFARDYGIQKLRVNGKPAAGVGFDFFSPTLRWEKRDIGTFALNQGAATLQVENAGKNVNAAPGQMFGLDYLLLQRVGPLPVVPPAVPVAPAVPKAAP